MGNRKFYNQLMGDMFQREKDRITDEIDVTTMKDYMQVRCLELMLDELAMVRLYIA